MTPIGKSTLGLGVGSVAAGASETIQRVGSGIPCDPDEAFISWYCPRDDTQVRTAVTCEQDRLCPRCSKRWAFRSARKAAWRLEKVRKGFQRSDGAWTFKVRGRLSPRHVVVSYISAIDPLTPQGATAHMRHAWRKLKKMGAKGGVGIYHPWRHAPSSQGPATAFWRLGVHSHWLIWGFLETSKRPEYMFVRVLRAYQESLVATLAYLLDHCGVWKRGHALRYYGIASYNGCVGVPPLPAQSIVPDCPECGGPMERLEGVIDLTDYGLPEFPPWWRDKLRGGPGDECERRAETGTLALAGDFAANGDHFPKGSVVGEGRSVGSGPGRVDTTAGGRGSPATKRRRGGVSAMGCGVQGVGRRTPAHETGGG